VLHSVKLHAVTPSLALRSVVRTMTLKQTAPPKSALEYTTVRHPLEVTQVADGNGEYCCGEPF